MSQSYIDEPMIEAYVYETSQILELLEQLMIQSEKTGGFSTEAINEIFRFMHTIKGSSAMMMFNDISTLAHQMEDVFYIIRGNESVSYDFTGLVDIILESIDFFKIELMKIRSGEKPDGSNEELVGKVTTYLGVMKKENDLVKGESNQSAVDKKSQQYYIRPSSKEATMNFFKAKIKFKGDSQMENIRAYTVVHNIANLVEEIHYKPRDIIENDQTLEDIRENGFLLVIQTKSNETVIKEYLDKTLFLENLEFESITSATYDQLAKAYATDVIDEEIKIPETSKKYVETKAIKQEATAQSAATAQTIISVNVDKLDKLMDMVGELVIAEAMVTQNPELKQLEIESFEKASRQLHKISSELQDMVMAIRMVPLSTTFMKMHRIVRDMTKKLEKNVVLEVRGEETEVDKNIIEKIADPLMHIIRNSLDHGIEDEQTRLIKGKNPQGTIILEAKNSGSDVLIIIKDDGKGLDKKVIYEKAYSQGLIHQAIEDMNEREIFNLILHPGFSTKEEVTEFSGRGVGMDVVSKNIESVGGSIIVYSEKDKGTTIILKIPLTLAIIEGMNIKVGAARFTIPIVSIQESFRPEKRQVIMDTEGQEMIMVRGLCYPIIRLHDFYEIPTDIRTYDTGILIMVHEDEKSGCIFADELIGQQQVVVKSLPNYIKKSKQIRGLGGCTLLGDGSISLILDVGELDLSMISK
jgi:two-component system, chemotaxis family, sensor kinase CheA